MRLLGLGGAALRGALAAPFAATIGVFDGLHIGHRELVEEGARQGGLASAVLTFRENPKRISRPRRFHGELSTLAQRLELIDSMGVDLCVLIDFSGDFSKLPGRQFLSMLCAGGDAPLPRRRRDFRCGHGSIPTPRTSASSAPSARSTSSSSRPYSGRGIPSARAGSGRRSSRAVWRRPRSCSAGPTRST